MQSLDPPRRRLALALAGLAGYVDAAGYLSADRYFVSFMSGNTTRLGVELARDPPSALFPAVLAGAFIGGVVLGALIAAWYEGRHKPPLLGGVAAALAAAAVLANRGHAAASLVVLAAAMGALNNAFQRGGHVAVGLTYMTGALVKLGQGIAARLQGRKAEAWRGWLALWLALAVGAAGGAAVAVPCPRAALWIAAGLAALLALAARRLPLPAG